jgi:alpha-beta hydrolase superfamily lysophospholipase
MDQSQREQQSISAQTIPENGDLYRYLCPVDHHGNAVHIKGLRTKAPTVSGPILFVHDVGERASMYWECLAYVCEKGFSSYVFDQRGHGRSIEQTGNIDHYQDLVTDLLQVASWIRHMHNGEPPLIVGQGYGALVATEMAAKYPAFIRGLILTAPTIQLAWTLSSTKKTVISFVSKIAPKVKVPTGLHPRFSNPIDREATKSIVSRFLRSIVKPNHARVTFAFARELLDSMESYQNFFGKIKVPTLILKPGADEVALYEKMDLIAASHENPSLITSRTMANVHHNGLTEGALSMSSILDEIISWGRHADSRKQVR